MMKNSELSRIEKRALEATVLAPVMAAVAERIGKDAAVALLLEVNEREAFQRGVEAGAQIDQIGISDLVNEVESWSEGTSMEFEVIEKTAETYHFNVTRCPYFEKYREMGLLEYGVALSCCRDDAFTRGFSAGLKLVRTQTIMEGADYCDFRYSFSSASDD